jgi:hypothetical protein
MRNLDNRKARNILELEMDEIIINAVKRVILLKALNSFSPRFFSFINLIVGEGFINPFFRFLDSSGKSAEMF